MTALTRVRSAVTGAVVGALALTGCSVYDAPLPGGPDAGDDPITVTARFRDVLDLVPQSTVKLDDVNVGKVTAVSLDGYVAEVTMKIRKDADIPADAAAQIRQTSLLGEKFVSLEVPQDSDAQPIADKAVIGLDRTGRNPEIEEVFGALALLLNGGGVGQLKSITEELNLALDGRSGDVRSVLRQIATFTGELDDNRASIIQALENTNRLAAQARAQQGTIEAALDDVPGALRSLNRQRADLVRLLESLERLSAVGTRVIRESKDATIASLTDLGPVLEAFADAGQDLPKAINVYLTYPFVDEAVGRDPQVARNLHMGDYTNLEVNLDLDLLDLPNLPGLPGLPEEVCANLDALLAGIESAVTPVLDSQLGDTVDQVEEGLGEALGRQDTRSLRQRALSDVLQTLRAEVSKQCRAPSPARIEGLVSQALARNLVRLDILNRSQLSDLLDGTLGDVLGGATGGGSGGGGGVLGGDGGGLLGGGSGDGLLGRAAPAYAGDADQIDPFGLAQLGLDPGVGTLLMQGVATNR